MSPTSFYLLTAGLAGAIFAGVLLGTSTGLELLAGQLRRLATLCDLNALTARGLADTLETGDWQLALNIGRQYLYATFALALYAAQQAWLDLKLVAELCCLEILRATLLVLRGLGLRSPPR